MRKILKNALVITLVTGLCLSIMGIATAEDLDVGEITVSPEEPTRESDVTFSVDVTGDNIIEEVWLTVEECTTTPIYFCHSELLNVSMENTEGDTWEVTATLVFDDTDEGHCWLVVKSNGSWYDYAPPEYESTDFTVVPDDDGSDGNGGDDTGDTGGTPGFELILMLISIVIALSIYKRKR